MAGLTCGHDVDRDPDQMWMQGSYAPIALELTIDELEVEGALPADMAGSASITTAGWCAWQLVSLAVAGLPWVRRRAAG